MRTESLKNFPSCANSHAEPLALCLPGSHGRHLLSTEPEDESAGAGARGGVQPGTETQHEETHLNRHVDTHTHMPLARQF